MIATYHIFFYGIITGLLLSVPIGAANILSLENTYKFGAFSGFITGSGATFGDFIFIIASLAGVISLNDFQQEYAFTFKYISIFILIIFSFFSIYKGVKQYYDINASKNLLEIHANNHTTKNFSYLSGFLATFILTITNPLTPIGVISAVTAIGLGGGIFIDKPLHTSILFLLGVLLSSLGWWYCLSQFAIKFSEKLTGRSLSFINYIGAFIMFSIVIYLFFMF